MEARNPEKYINRIRHLESVSRTAPPEKKIRIYRVIMRIYSDKLNNAEKTNEYAEKVLTADPKMFNEICESLLNMHENLLRIDEKVDSLIEMQEQTSKVYDQIIETTKQAISRTPITDKEVQTAKANLDELIDKLIDPSNLS